MTAHSVLPESLAGWLDYQQAIHPADIELGLERVRRVARRLGIGQIAPRVLIVAGTNGKGSSVAILSALQSAAGRRVGSYTSPHLLDYRERIRLPDGLVHESELIRAFMRIEQARAGIALTQFEFGTLAALLCLGDAGLDVAILEVGLGGRLDATNLVDADAALITTIGLDHQAWLGSDREAIGREKAGVLRAGQVALYADQPAVGSVLAAARELGCRLLRPAVDYRYWRTGDHWHFEFREVRLALPWPAALHAPWQIHNLAACVALTLALEPDFALPALRSGVAAARIDGRLQQLSQHPEVWLDIAHNPQAAASLQAWLHTQPRKPTFAVFGALADKDVAAVVAELVAVVDHWYLVPLDTLSARGLAAEQLRRRLPAQLACSEQSSVDSALHAATAAAQACGGRVLAFGSFVLAEQVLRWWPRTGAAGPVSFAPERQ